jgi:hypothetical protein
MVNLLGETNAPTKPTPTQNTSTSSDIDVFVSGTPKPTPTSPKTTSPKTIANNIASDLIDVITPKPKSPTPTPIIPQPTDTTDVLDAYGNPKTEDEQTCPEGYSKNYNRRGELECLPNYNDIPEDRKTPLPLEPTTTPQVTKNLKPLIYGVGIIVGIILVSKILKSN